MVATQHSRSGSRAQDGGRSAEITAVERLLDQAADFELRAPELALVLGERAAALAEAAGAEELWVRGEGLAVSARVRLGLRAPTVGRAVAALRAAEDAGDTLLAARLRTDLAICARSVGAPLTGLAALRPVLDVRGFAGAHKAAALSQLVGCLSQFGRKPELDRTLAEADRLCGADDRLDGDGRLLARALLRVAVSAHRRRHGDVIGAADAARTGLGFLEQIEDPQHDGGVVRVRLVLQLVCSLLDRGDGPNALEIARPILDEPARAAAVAPAGWLRMAIATRVLLPSGSVEAAARMLRDAVHVTDRHELHSLTARLWTELAHMEERLGRYAEAIECLQLARAAEHVHARARRQAVGLLAGEFGGGGHAEVDLDHVLGSVPERDGAVASVAVAPLSVPESTVPASREPGSEVKKEAADAPRPRDAGEQLGETTNRAESGRSGRPGRSLAPEPADERPSEVAKASRSEQRDELAKPSRSEQRDEVKASRFERSDKADKAARSGRSDVADKASRSGRSDEVGQASRSGRSDEVEKAWRSGRSDEVEKAWRSGRSDEADRAPRPGRSDETDRARRSERSDGVAQGVRRRRSDDVVGASRLEQLDVAATAPRHDETVSVARAEQSDDAAKVSRFDTAGDVEKTLSGADRTEEAHGSRDQAAGAVARERTEDVVSSRGERAGDGDEDDAAASRQQDERAGSRAASRKTRHDSEHGSVAARSVLDRLGISTGAGGGRRRAADSAEPGRSDSGGRRRAEENASREDSDSPGESWLSKDSEPVSRAEVAPDARSERALEPEDKARGNESAPSTPVIDNWLPRLRLPPSLAPWDEFADTDGDTTSSMSETPFTNAPVLRDDDLGEPFRSELSGVPEDDLPEDAGLADLLARALAEHQAGAASAAAIVKRLGNQSPSEPRTVNGHGRNGAEPGSGRHRGDG